MIENRIKSGFSLMHKIGIMTWYHYRNYGTALQATALYKVISDLGYNPSLIKYMPVGNVLEKMTVKKFFIKGYNWFLSHVFCPMYYHNDVKEKLFTTYLNERITETEPVISNDDFSKLNKKFDAFVCGSDQIWSPLNYNDKYYLSFVSDPNKKVAYAPSMGVSEIADPKVKRRITSLLKDFKHLSVREKQGAAIIKELTGRDAKIVLDPTLLLTAEEWDAFADISSTQKLKRPYIFCYYLGKPSKYKKTVKAAAKKWNMPVYEIPTVRDRGGYAKFPFEVGPSEFVSLIKNASFVFTDSFHGMVFSIIYKIPFAVFERFEKNDPRNQNSRIYSIIELLGLQNRMVNVVERERIYNMSEMDYTDPYLSLAKLKEQSLEYLKNSLLDAVKSE